MYTTHKLINEMAKAKNVGLSRKTGGYPRGNSTVLYHSTYCIQLQAIQALVHSLQNLTPLISHSELNSYI